MHKHKAIPHPLRTWYNNAIVLEQYKNAAKSEKNTSVLEVVSSELVDSFNEHNEDAKRKILDAILILGDFSKESKGDEDRRYLFDAAALLAILENSNGDKQSLSAYFVESEDYQVVNRQHDVCVILSDAKYLQGTIGAHREKHFLQPSQEELFDDNDPQHKWRQTYDMYPARTLYEMTRETSRYGMIVNACSLLRRISDYKNTNRSEEDVLRDIIDVETVYAPLCEITGYDGIATTLRHYALLNRYVRMGKVELVRNAEEYLGAMFGTEGKRTTYETTLRTIFSSLEVASSVDQQSGFHHADVGEFIGRLELEDGEEHVVKGNYRIKSVGSLVEKVSELERKQESQEYNGNNELVPMDLLGAAVIVKDTEETASVLKALVSKITTSTTMRFRASPSRKHAVQIRGDDVYVNKVASEARFSESLTEFKRNEDPDGYEVSKVTFEVNVGGILPNWIKVEVQVLTKEMRRSGRRGVRSHSMYSKYEDKGMTSEEKRENAEYLELIYEWGKETKRTGEEEAPFSPRSSQRARKLMQQILAA